MKNTDTDAALEFHTLTKYIRVRDESGDEQPAMGEPPNTRRSIGEQDPDNEPRPYKIYSSLEPIALPREFDAPSMPGLTAIASPGIESDEETIPTLTDLARICLYSNGILKRGSQDGTQRQGKSTGRERVIEYRFAGGTGARYHLEIYLVCQDLPGLGAGVYHYAANDHSLRQIRRGDFRQALIKATGAEPSVARAPVTLIVTSTFWRNAWRYVERAYRHAYWDMGTTLSNVLALAASASMPAKVVLGYVDAEVNLLLDVDGEREAAVGLVALGHASQEPPAAPEVKRLNLPTEPVSSSEIEFPEIITMHRASSLGSGDEVARWRSNPLRRTVAEPAGKLVPLEPISRDKLTDRPLDDIVRSRRSVRNYKAETPAPFDSVSTLLDITSHGFLADCLNHTAVPLSDRYLIVNNVAGLEPGLYLHHPHRQAIELLEAGDFRRDAERIASNHPYAGDAHVNSYSLVDLQPILDRYGNRGYRVAQTEASLLTSKLHLAAHAVGLRAIAQTSLDNEIIELFSPHATGKSYLFALIFGILRKRSD